MYCRLCLNKFKMKELLTLLSTADDEWSQMCWDYLHIEIKRTDEYSKSICQKCLKVLKEFHIFRQHAQKCQRLLPQLHLELNETESIESEASQKQYGKIIKSEPIESEYISDCSTAIEGNNTAPSSLENQNSIFVITETLDSLSNLEKAKTNKSLKRARTARTEEFADYTKTSITENKPPEKQAANEELPTNLAIKIECLENEFEDDTFQNPRDYTFKDEFENEFEATEYELHVPAAKTFIETETPPKKLRTVFRGNYNENEEILKHKQNVAQKQANSEWLLQVDSPFDLPEKHFRKVYHMSRDLSQFLIQNLDDQLRGSRVTAISSEKLVLAALHFYATGNFKDTVEDLWVNNLSHTLIGRAIHKVTDAINVKLCQQNIRFPMTSIERQAAKRLFATASAPFIGAIGAINCMHIAIAPTAGEINETYLNEAGFHSINVQMICDPTLKILNVNARFGGSKDNAYIWNASVARSVMKRVFDNVDPFGFLLGDAKYPLEPWLMTPLSNSVKGSAEFLYNNALCKAREPVQQLFCILKATWQCLSDQRGLEYNPRFVGRIVNACSVLHNIKLSHHDYNLQDFAELELPSDNFYKGESALLSTDLMTLDTAKNIRNRIIANYYTN